MELGNAGDSVIRNSYRRARPGVRFARPGYSGMGFMAQATDAFSKKFENFKAAVALDYGYYNFITLPNSHCQRSSLLLGNEIAHAHRWKRNNPMKLKNPLVNILAVLTLPLVGTVAPAATVEVLQTFDFPGEGN